MSLYAVKKTEYTYQSPKTKSSRRLIQLDTNTIQLLHDYKIKQQKKMLSLGFNSNNPTQPIFVTNRNTSVPPERLNRILNKIIQEHQLPPITIHGFRHTHCSLLFESGATIQEVKERLGHANINPESSIQLTL